METCSNAHQKTCEHLLLPFISVSCRHGCKLSFDAFSVNSFSSTACLKSTIYGILCYVQSADRWFSQLIMSIFTFSQYLIQQIQQCVITPRCLYPDSLTLMHTVKNKNQYLVVALRPFFSVKYFLKNFLFINVPLLLV